MWRYVACEQSYSAPKVTAACSRPDPPTLEKYRPCRRVSHGGGNSTYNRKIHVQLRFTF